MLNYTLTKLSEATVHGNGGKGKGGKGKGGGGSSSSSSSSPHPHIYERGPGTYSVASCYNDDRYCGVGGADSSVGSSDEWVDIDETDAENEGDTAAAAAAAAVLLERSISFAR